MAYDTTTTLRVTSDRMGSVYDVNRFREYRVDIDLEMDADGFNMVFENPDGIYTGIFNKFDHVEMLINNVKVLYGQMDSCEYVWDETESVIQVVGRDMCGILVDNDALPGTFYNVKPSSYIAKKCQEYGIPNHNLDTSVGTVDKLIVGTQESEISIMNNIIMDDHKRIWSIYDTLYMGDWDTGAQPTYYFTRGVPQGQAGIPIKRLSLKDDGTDMKSEVRIYGSMDDGSEKVMGTAKNDYMVGKGIKRRRVLRSYNDDSSSKYSSNALRDVRESFRSGIVLEIAIYTKYATVLPNRTAHVVDAVTKTNSVFFIKSVSYQKNGSDGSMTVIQMIPGDTSFDVIWKSTSSKSLQGTHTMSIEELLKSRK